MAAARGGAPVAEETQLAAIFLDYLGEASLIPFVQPLTLEAMRLFGGYSFLYPALVALAGACAGALLNWGAGRALGWLRPRVSWLGTRTFPRLQYAFQRGGFVVAALFWLPLGGIVVAAMGFFRVGLAKVLPTLFAGGLYYLWPYLQLAYHSAKGTGV